MCKVDYSSFCFYACINAARKGSAFVVPMPALCCPFWIYGALRICARLFWRCLEDEAGRADSKKPSIQQPLEVTGVTYFVQCLRHETWVVVQAFPETKYFRTPHSPFIVRGRHADPVPWHSRERWWNKTPWCTIAPKDPRQFGLGCPPSDPSRPPHSKQSVQSLHVRWIGATLNLRPKKPMLN